MLASYTHQVNKHLYQKTEFFSLT